MNNYIQAASKESIETFFGIGNKKPFLIPEYQRPYEWGVSEISALLNDLNNFNDAEIEFELFNPDTPADDEYFIGTIIYFENASEGKKRELVDGQQRIVSMFLIFRAIYEILDKDQRFAEIQNLCDTIQKLIWETDPMNGEIISPNISSRAISDGENQIFTNILTKGKAEPKRRDNYSQNYRVIQKFLLDLATDVDRFKSFILRLMKQTIVLPIEATNFDATLEIFERINDRGKQLTDSDIFKAKIYTALLDIKRSDFTQKWKILEEDAKNLGVTMEDLFTYQMYFERALSPYDDGKQVIGLRKYFLYKSQQIHDPKLLPQLRKILDLIKVMKFQGAIVGASWSRDFEIRKLLSVIWSASNDLWRYPIVIYYLAHIDAEDFPEQFQRFCKKFIATMSILKADDQPSNSIRRFIMNLNHGAIPSIHPKFDLDSKIDLESKTSAEIHENLRKSPKFIRTILSTLAYADEDQTSLLPINWEIEYIYPRYKSRRHPFEGESRDKIEELGNLTPIEKRLKHPAIGNFFMSKKLVYKNSQVAMTQKLAENNQWTSEEISNRTTELIEQLKSIWKNWNDEYEVE